MDSGPHITDHLPYDTDRRYQHVRSLPWRMTSGRLGSRSVGRSVGLPPSAHHLDERVIQHADVTADQPLIRQRIINNRQQLSPRSDGWRPTRSARSTTRISRPISAGYRPIALAVTGNGKLLVYITNCLINRSSNYQRGMLNVPLCRQYGVFCGAVLIEPYCFSVASRAGWKGKRRDGRFGCRTEAYHCFVSVFSVARHAYLFIDTGRYVLQSDELLTKKNYWNIINRNVQYISNNAINPELTGNAINF